MFLLEMQGQLRSLQRDMAEIISCVGLFKEGDDFRKGVALGKRPERGMTSPKPS